MSGRRSRWARRLPSKEFGGVPGIWFSDAAPDVISHSSSHRCMGKPEGGVELPWSQAGSSSPFPHERIKLDQWNPAKVWTGSKHQKCVFCKEVINRGEWSKQHRIHGHVYHDDCAEDLGAYSGSKV